LMNDVLEANWNTFSKQYGLKNFQFGVGNVYGTANLIP
jgi:hypothetical protein